MDIGKELRVIEAEELDLDFSPLELEPEEESMLPGLTREEND